MMNKITIAGCGTLGSILCLKLCLLSREEDVNISEINLIDFDEIDIKNFPYLTLSKNTYRDMNKAEALAHALREVNIILKLNPIKEKLTKAVLEKHDISDTYLIDCRDTGSEKSYSNLKINLDGHYGRINFSPQHRKRGGDSRYRIFNSRFCADVLASIVCRIIYDEDFRIKYSGGNSTAYTVDLKYFPENLYATN